MTYSDEDDEVNCVEDSSNQNVHDDWENLDEKDYDVNQVLISKPKLKKSLVSHLKTENAQEKTLFTSTPSHDKTVKKTSITQDQNDFNKILIDNAKTPLEKPNEMLNNGTGGGIGGRVDLVDDLKKDQKSIDNKRNEFVITKEANELLEKILNLMSSLIWEGINSSNEEAWKVWLFINYNFV